MSEPQVGAEDSVSGGFSLHGLEAIRKMMETAITDPCITAGIAMVARDGEIVWLATAGQMAPGIPMRDDATLPLTSGNGVS